MKRLLCLFFSLLSITTLAQSPSQTVRGSVRDIASGQVLIGAVVRLANADTTYGAVSDFNGDFVLTNVPIGKYEMNIAYAGYSPRNIPLVSVNAGKELVLSIDMEESVEQMKTVEIVAEENKREPLNAMNTVSSRTFSVEETQKYAAAVNDPGRMAVSFAGVISTDDGGNKIAVRGNSPYGLLWRMEGLDIPNPNHFANQATSGGGISILSAQTLSNSDFMTGAFSAEYGNALAAVFDLRLRKGNNQKREYTFQAGVLGFDFAAEGPFKNGYDGSYLINARISTLSVLGKLGVPIGTAVTNFNDLSYHFFLPTQKAGQFQLYGFLGLSNQHDNAKRDSTAWEYDWQRYDRVFFSNTLAVGIKHRISLGEKSYLQSGIMLSGNDYGYHQEKLDDSYLLTRDYEEKHRNEKITVSSVLNYKRDAKNSFRTGAYFNAYGFSLLQRIWNTDLNGLDTQLDAGGDLTTVQVFGQWKHKFNDRLTTTNGVHVLHLPLNESISVEPRLALRYQMTALTDVTLGYGLHSQMQPLGVYYSQKMNDQGVYEMHNKNLGFNKAHHLVAGVKRSMNEWVYLKTEVYYQQLFNIAIGADSGSTVSTLNNTENYQIERMNNNGKGRNYGVELTLEQFTHNDFYYLLSVSLYQSEYQTETNKWYNTRYNGNFAIVATGGKEWRVGRSDKNRTLGLNGRIMYAGGLRQSPVDIPSSIHYGYTQYINDQPFTEQVKDYFRTDVRLSIKTNRQKTTGTLALDLQNATNYKNVYGSYYDVDSRSTRTMYQLPILPILSYRLEF